MFTRPCSELLQRSAELPSPIMLSSRESASANRWDMEYSLEQSSIAEGQPDRAVDTEMPKMLARYLRSSFPARSPPCWRPSAGSGWCSGRWTTRVIFTLAGTHLHHASTPCSQWPVVPGGYSGHGAGVYPVSTMANLARARTKCPCDYEALPVYCLGLCSDASLLPSV